MLDVIMKCEFAEPVVLDEFLLKWRATLACLARYRATWEESLLSEDGLNLVCRFTAPDKESIRQLSRGDTSVKKEIWSGGVTDTGRTELATAVVERRFEKPVTLESIQAIEDAGAWCLEQHRVHFLRTFFSSDRTHMICLYAAPDAESVRKAQLQAQMPLDRVWACRRYVPADLA